MIYYNPKILISSGVGDLNDRFYNNIIIATNFKCTKK